MDDGPAPGPRRFATTHWSLVVAAGANNADATGARMALEELCRAYWYPLYAFVRWRGHSADEAQDLTQAFFARILEKGGFATADPARGRFRSWLLGALKNFLANEWHRSRAQKRGGGTPLLAWDALSPEARYALEPAETIDPGAGFDREWARETVDRALTKLRKEWAERGREEQFDGLAGSLTGDEPDRAMTAERLSMTVGAVKVAVHRLRQRYRELLREEIEETVADPSEVDAEMRHLADALRTN